MSQIQVTENAKKELMRFSELNSEKALRLFIQGFG